MNYIDSSFLKKFKLPAKNSHKGDNGKLTIIGGSQLFHGASLFALKTASRIVDMVYFSSIKQNQELTSYLKKRLYSFINIPTDKESDYIAESDAILIGPGMVRGSKKFTGTHETGIQTKDKVLSLIKNFPNKKWVIDAGALQVIKPEHLFDLPNCIITPHEKEFYSLFGHNLTNLNLQEKSNLIAQTAKDFTLTIILKGRIDIIASPEKIILNKTGNPGMTKGGTGDVLAGLVSALFCTHDSFTSASIGTYINGLAGDKLWKKRGPFFNADDLVNQVPTTLWKEVNQLS
jgi:hydroxyethylthiazole kinase-like uncharacterized protein yjeF